MSLFNIVSRVREYLARTPDNGGFSTAKHDTVYADTISELTSAAGVTIDGVLLKDNTITTSSIGTPGDPLAGIEMDRIIETPFDPKERVYHRFAFDGKAVSANVNSDWSVFKSVMSANMDWTFSKSATGGGCTANSDGGMVLSGSNSSALVFLKPRTGSRLNKIKWSTSKELRFRLLLKTGTITNARYLIGLESVAVPKFLRNSAPDSNRVEVYLDQGADSQWHVRTGHSSGSSSATASGVVASTTVYDIDIRVSSTRIVTVRINGTTVYTGTTPLKASKTLIPIIGHQSEGAKRNMSLFYGEISQSYS